MQHIDRFFELGNQVVGVLVTLQIIVLNVLQLRGEIFQRIELGVRVLDTKPVELVTGIAQCDRCYIADQATLFQHDTESTHGLDRNISGVKTLHLFAQFHLVHLDCIQLNRIVAHQVKHLPDLDALGNRL